MTTTSELATLEQLASASTGKRRFVETVLPVSGLRVRIRSLTEREASDYQAHVFSANNDKTRQARLRSANRLLIAKCLVDGEGNRIVPDDQIVALADMDWADASHLYDVCAAHSGMNNADIEALVKNSEPTTPSDSPTS